MNINRQDPEAVVGFFPSDHHTDEDKFMAGVELAFAAAESNPERVILLGVAARHAETDYGWIEAEPALSTATSDGILCEAAVGKAVPAYGGGSSRKGLCLEYFCYDRPGSSVSRHDWSERSRGTSAVCPGDGIRHCGWELRAPKGSL